MSDFIYISVPRGSAGGGSVLPKPASTGDLSSSLSSSQLGTPSATPSPGVKVAQYAVPAVAAVSAAAVVVSVGKLMWRRHTRGQRSKSNTPPRGRTPPGGGGRSASRIHQEEEAYGSPRLPGEKYTKMEEIGRGAFGIVYVGRHYRTGTLVAIKEMDSACSDELKVEYQLMQGLTHPNIVELVGFEVSNGRARLYLEWVAGGSLHTLVEKYGPIQEEELLRSYVKQIVLGLKFLHDKGLLHRDIKPKNILVDHKGTLKLTDFGLSRHTESMHAQTRAAGTPVYMAPECPRGRFSIGSDIWALGATISELVTGRMPWSHVDPHILESPLSLLFHIGNMQGQKGHHPEIPSRLSPDAKDFMLKCFAPYADQRGTCDDLLKHPFLAHASSSSFSPQESWTTSSSGKQTVEMKQNTATYLTDISTDSSMQGTNYTNKTPPLNAATERSIATPSPTNTSESEGTATPGAENAP